MDITGPTSLDALAWTAVLLGAYLLGAIPTAYLAGRWFKGQDVRRMGDGNAGAANLARIAGARAGLAVGAFDIGKGAAAVVLARMLLDAPLGEMAAGVLAIAGHTWPVYLRGRGGRGAATAVGVLLATVPLVAFPIAVPAFAVLYFTRSTAKALAVYYIPIPFLALWPAEYPYPLAAYSLAVPLLVGLSHYLSLRRAPASDGL